MARIPVHSTGISHVVSAVLQRAPLQLLNLKRRLIIWIDSDNNFVTTIDRKGQTMILGIGASLAASPDFYPPWIPPAMVSAVSTRC